MGFGGSSPCAQKQGEQVFIDEHPESILQYGKFEPKPVVFGANKHEGSYVLGGTNFPDIFLDSLVIFTFQLFTTNILSPED